MTNRRYLESDFIDFLQELIEAKKIESSKEIEIVEITINEGFETLSDKQKVIFNKLISPYDCECKNCGDEIPWVEMPEAKEDGTKRCGWCNAKASNFYR